MFARKPYLDGFDWTALFLNSECARTPGKGNHFTLMLQAEGQFQEKELRKFLAPLRSGEEIFNGTIRRHPLHLAPWWKKGKRGEVPFTSEDMPYRNDFPEILNRFCNQPLPANRSLAVHWVRNGNGDFLLFKFSHLLFDGRGAELLLECLRSGVLFKNDDPPPGLDSPNLNQWKKQFSCGRQIQNLLLAIHRAGKIISHPAPPHSEAFFRIISLTEQETENILARSDREAGPFMMTPFLLALTASEYRNILAENESGNILVPMSVNMRGQEEIPAGTMLFNQWSMLPLLIREESFENGKKLIAELRKNIFVSTGERIAAAYRTASRLSRIIPPWILHRIVAKIGPVCSGTFMFSFLPETSLEQNTAAGAKIENLVHLPSMPPITGLGIFFNLFNNRLNAVISGRKEVFDEDKLERFCTALEQNLRGIK